MNKKISIIIATWNAAKTLHGCLDSIVSQLTDETELLIIDGGSKDDTMNIVESYGSKIAYSVSEKDKGIYDAWNKGIKAAKGQWVMFVGADDILLSDAISTYMDVIHTTKDISSYDYICAYNEHVDRNGKVLKIIGGAPEWKKYRSKMIAAHVGSLHNRQNLFERYGMYNLRYRICADYELLLRKKNNLKYIFIPHRIARMKVGGMSFSTKAIVETYKIRKLHHTLPFMLNELWLIRDWMAFKFFIVRKKIAGGKF